MLVTRDMALLESSDVQGKQKLLNLLEDIFHGLGTTPHTVGHLLCGLCHALLSSVPLQPSPLGASFLVSVNSSAHPGAASLKRLQLLTQSQKGLLYGLPEYEVTLSLVRAPCHLYDQASSLTELPTMPLPLATGLDTIAQPFSAPDRAAVIIIQTKHL